jgi:hypothetical protein
MMPDVVTLDVTRPSRDGGRDGVGQLRVGTGASGILVDFALEAKCYSATSSVGVREMLHEPRPGDIDERLTESRTADRFPHADCSWMP